MKMLFLLLAIVLGIIFPFGHEYTFIVRYILMVMLLGVFLEIKVESSLFRKSHLYIMLSIMIISMAGFYLLQSWSQNWGWVAYVVAIMPTAAAAPVLTGFLKGDVAYVTFSVMLTSLGVAFFIPLSTPLILSGTIELSILDVLIPVAITVFVPFVLAMLIRKFLPPLYHFLLPYTSHTIYLFMINVYVAISKASYFVRYETDAPTYEIVGIGVISLVIGAIHFGLGSLLDKGKYSSAASMALGRKNTMFSIWLALTYFNPLVAVGPMFYIVWQNLYHTFVIYRFDRLEKRKKTTETS